MAKNRITDQPKKPTSTRRGGRDFYELGILAIWLGLGILGFFMQILRPDWVDAGNYETSMKSVLVGWIICSIILYRFDRAAIVRGRETYEYGMKEYEMLRSKWLEAEAERMELQRKYATQYTHVSDNMIVQIEQEPSSDEETEQESDEAVEA